MKPHRIATDTHAREFRLLRNRIEAEMNAPAVVLVTSATERDGTAFTAFGLAESLSKTHQRAALVTTATAPAAQPANGAGGDAPLRRASDRLEAGSRRQPGQLEIISISHERLSTISRSNVAELVQELRGQHDYIVIDGGDLPNNSFGILIAALADAILVTFLAGRRETAADRAMLESLERSEAKMLGVVMNDERALERALEHQGEAVEVPDAPERRVLPFAGRFAVNRQSVSKVG